VKPEDQEFMASMDSIASSRHHGQYRECIQKKKKKKERKKESRKGKEERLGVV
jgi:hypothetical protein